MPNVENVPDDCWRERVEPAALLTRWAGEPSLCRMVNELVAEMAPGDEMWFYDIGAFTGLAIRRSGRAVKTRTYLHAYVPPPELVIRWAGSAPTRAELAALRKVDPHLRDMPPHEAMVLIGHESRWRLGPFPSCDVDAIERRCRELGLIVERA